MHPAVIAQAAATVACMMPGRFFLGVGTGENLNEHIVGGRWPAPEKYIDAGYDHVYVHQIGPDQEGFLRFYSSDVLPRIGNSTAAA